MTTFVKICGLTDETAIETAVDAGADAIGFVFFDKSPRNITPQAASRLAKYIPAQVRRVAVMRHPAAALWDEVQQVLQPDALQTDSEDFAYLTVAATVDKWPVLREGAVPDTESLPATFIYEGRNSGRGQTVDWDAAAAIATRGNMILAGGLDQGNVATAIARVAPYGVDVSSAVESQPGIKDAAKIRAFIEAAKAAA